jgi:integrase
MRAGCGTRCTRRSGRRHARGIRLSDDRLASRRGHRCRARREGASADLDDEDGNRLAPSRTNRIARVSGHRSGENPARWKGHLDHILPAKGTVARVEHHASLPYADMPAFWPRMQMQGGLGARALELCTLTACRIGEILGARWPEVDLDAARTRPFPASSPPGRSVGSPAPSPARSARSIRDRSGPTEARPLAARVAESLLVGFTATLTARGNADFLDMRLRRLPADCSRRSTSPATADGSRRSMGSPSFSARARPLLLGVAT